MKKLLFIVVALMLTHTSIVNAQPQWKFYLAFEDGIGAKDTMWFIWDTTASIYGIDTTLGEGNVNFNYGYFNVFSFLGFYPNVDSTKVFAIPYNEYFELELEAFNYILPIKLSWDTSLFHADYLPPEPVGWVNYAVMESNYFFMAGNDPFNHNFNMTVIDTVMSPDPSITDPWFWNPSIHFPIMLMMHQEETTSIKNVPNNDVLDIIISPNPVKNYLNIKSNKPFNKARILDFNGRKLLECDLLSDIFSLDISDLPNGIYFINLINYQNQNYYEKFIKTD